MPRVKRGTIGAKRRRSILKQAKGYRFGRGTKERQAREAILHAGVYAFAHRRDKKNVRRRLWNVKLSAALKEHGYSYSRFIGQLKTKKVDLDRKVLAQMAEFQPELFNRVVKSVA